MKKFIFILVVLGILEISLALYLTEWRHVFWDFVAKKNSIGFIRQLGIFTIVAVSICIVSAYTSYLTSLAGIEWRKTLNDKALSMPSSQIENSNQRIQEDSKEYPNLVLTIIYGCISSLAYFIVFSITLCYQFSYKYLIILFLYAIISTFVARKIAAPLMSLNYKSQAAEASYRNNLTPLNFELCIATMIGLAKKTKRLNYFQTLYGQLGVIIPVLIIAPQYFNSALTLGALMQATSIMSTILDNLSYGVNQYDAINRLRASKRRLREMGVV